MSYISIPGFLSVTCKLANRLASKRDEMTKVISALMLPRDSRMVRDRELLEHNYSTKHWDSNPSSRLLSQMCPFKKYAPPIQILGGPESELWKPNTKASTRDFQARPPLLTSGTNVFKEPVFFFSSSFFFNRATGKCLGYYKTRHIFLRQELFWSVFETS